MAPMLYALCALTASFCAWLLLRAYYHQSRYRLLLWGGLCFIGLTLNNALLVVDKLLLPDVNLFTWRLILALVALLVLLYGIIWDAE
ncbi:MAG TPA: DUF5985 family protein [Candidatus Binatia bacterium]|nr:DUF5985 family protein [Candidatus Binatia bacterium]